MNAGEDACDVLVRQWVIENDRLEGAGARLSQIILALVIIDAMAWAGLPAERHRVTRTDYKAWVQRYLRQEPRPGEALEYNYNPEQVYLYRCGMLHTMSGQHLSIAFHDGSHHRHRPDLDANFVGISISRLYEDLWLGIARFRADAVANGSYGIIQERCAEMFRLVPSTDGPNDAAAVPPPDPIA